MEPDLKLRLRTLILFMLCVVILLGRCGRTSGSSSFINPLLKITYTNLFKFEMKSDSYLGIVRELATKSGFIYKRQIVAEFYLFLRDDILTYSKEPYDIEKIQAAKDRMSEYVIAIEQDYIRTWDESIWDNLPRNVTLPTLRSAFKLDSDENLEEPLVQYSGTEPEIEECKGRDVYIAFLDIGFELDHPNLQKSTDASLSHDFFGYSGVRPDRFCSDAESDWGEQYYKICSHGTQCMGLVGAEEGNGCDRGVSPKAKLVGLKAFSNLMADTYEALALSYRHGVIDVFSCSYGVPDNTGFHEPRDATKKALMEGATKSRSCRGIVYMFPSGNGHHDNCNTDGYANSIYTITIAQVRMNNTLPQNKEVCAAAIAATVGDGHQRTTSLNGKCGAGFDGTSASCAIAAGYVGELIASRPCLSKRDIEHIMVRTARTDSMIEWKKNGAGRKFHDEIGFGVLDLGLMLTAAKTWKHVPKVHKCEVTLADTGNINGTDWKLKKTAVSDGCRTRANHVKYLEHVQVEMKLHCSQVFQVAIRLISPNLTVSNILTKMNVTSVNSASFQKLHWTFMSVNFWGEKSYGPWDIEVVLENSTSEVTCDYNVEKLILHGTASDPAKGGDPYTCTPERISENGPDGSPPARIIVPLVLILFILLVAVCLYCLYRRRQRRNTEQSLSGQNVGYSARVGEVDENRVILNQNLDHEINNDEMS